MTFNSMEELKNYILSKSQIAIRVAQEEVYGIIHKFVKQYYSEYDPSVYERTYQLLRSLVKTDVISTGNGWEAQIYFDIGALDYTIKTFTKSDYYWDGAYHNPFNNDMSSNGVFQNPKGSGEKTMQSAAHGYHGGKASGTAIWDEPIKILNREAINILKKWLIKYDIPLK